MFLPSLTGFYRVLPGFTGFYRVLPGFTGFYRVLPGFLRMVVLEWRLGLKAAVTQVLLLPLCK